MVVWEHEYSSIDTDIYARGYDAIGNPLGSYFTIASWTEDTTAPEIASGGSSEEWLVVWQQALGGGSGYAIKGFRWGPAINTYFFDVASAFSQAILTEMPGVYNVVPDDYIRLSALNRLIGVKFAPRLPVWLARMVTLIQWRYLGSTVHPSWVDSMLVDATLSNARLKSTGWLPQYTSEAAVRSAG